MKSRLGLVAVCALVPLVGAAADNPPATTGSENNPAPPAPNYELGSAPAYGIGAQPYGIGVESYGSPSTVYARDLRADRTQLGVSLGVSETDNVDLAANGRSQTLAVAGVDFDLRRRGSHLTTDAKGIFSYIDFIQNAYSGKVLGRFDGEAAWAFIPERLSWVVSDSFGDSQVDPFASVTPNNIEYVNVVSTGPDLTLRAAESTDVKLGARYTAIRYERSPFDGSRRMASASLEHEFSIASSLSLNVMVQQLRFDNTTVNTDYDLRKAFVRYQARGSRTEIAFAAGASQSTLQHPVYTTPFAQLDVGRVISPAMSVSLTIGRQLTDAGDAFRNLQSGAVGGVSIAPVTTTTANYVTTYANAGWHFQRFRTALDLTGIFERDSYPAPYSNLSNVRRTGAQLRLGRRLTQLLSAEAFGAWSHEDFFQRALSDDYEMFGAGLQLMPGRHLQIGIRYTRTRRVPGSGAAVGYSENRGLITAEYRPFP